MKVLSQTAEALFLDRVTDGWTSKSWNWNGYSGSTTDGISFGRREDGFLVRLSGDLAMHNWQRIAALADNITRLDLQVTGLDTENDIDWAVKAKASSANEARIKAGMTRTNLIQSTPSGSTYYIGSRGSDRFLRVYNKTAESNGAWPATSWRWEVEYKAGLANAVAERLSTSENAHHLIHSRVWQDFNQWLITVPCPTVGPKWRPYVPVEETSDQKRLAWLRRCIRPMIDKMSQSYDVETLSQALGFHWITDELAGTSAVYLLHGDTLRIDETGSEPLE
jgi:DNA relaxase NicK